MYWAPSNWSNLFFLAPLIAAGFLYNWVFFIIILLQMIFSILYHGIKEPDETDWWWAKKSKKQFILQILDTGFAFALVVLSIFVFINSLPMTLLHWVALGLVPVLLVLFFAEENHYELIHSLWHIASALVVTIVLFL
jgi:membrane-bound metal-dependent hydrolase YbcI (DUF457 family)